MKEWVDHWTRTRDAVFELTKTFDEDEQWKFSKLLEWLNANDYLTACGEPYITTRGVASLVSSTFWYVRDTLELGDEGADYIKYSFVNQHGEFTF